MKKKPFVSETFGKKAKCCAILFYFIFLFRKLAMRYAILKTKLTVFYKQKLFRGDLSYREP